MYYGGLPCASLVSTLGVVYSFLSYSTTGFGGPGFVLALNLGAVVGRLVGISTLRTDQYWVCLLSACFVVSYTLVIYALFIIGLDGSVCLWNIYSSCISTCVFSDPTVANWATIVVLVRASKRSRSALVAAYLEGIQCIFVFSG